MSPKHVVDVVLADHDADWYVGNTTTDYRWSRYYAIRAEIRNKIEDASQRNTRIVTYPKSIRNGYVGAAYDGAIMDGDDISCIYGRDDKNTSNTTEVTNGHCLGHLAHEFGHTYGLGHTGETNRDCMRYGLYDLDKVCDFGEENRVAVIEKDSNEGWLDANPSETVDGYKEYPYIGNTLALMKSPIEESELDSDTVTFTWSKPLTNNNFKIDIGSMGLGSNNIYSATTSDSSIVVNSLPLDGSVIYVRLSTLDKEKWKYMDYNYTASALLAEGKVPNIITPNSGSVLAGKLATFTWTSNGADIEKYRLLVGSTKRGFNYYNSSLSPDKTAVTITDLPEDGSIVYVQLKYKLKGRWYKDDYKYIAINKITPTLVSPVIGTTLSSDTQIFTWTSNRVTVSKYKVYVGSCKGCSDYYKSTSLSSDIDSIMVNDLPTDGSKVYVKFLYVNSHTKQRQINHCSYTASE